MDYIELNRQVAVKYSNTYPSGARKMNETFMAEVYEVLFELEADYGEFCEAMKLYRYEIDSSFPPEGPKLIPFIKRQRKGASESKGSSSPNIKVDFFNMVTNLGWSDAVRVFSSEPDKADWLSTIDIMTPYSCFSSWGQEYLKIFHRGDILEALQYYIDNSGQKDLVAMKKQLWVMDNLSYDDRKKFYPVFRDKTLKGNFKNKFLLKPNYSGISVQRRTA